MKRKVCVLTATRAEYGLFKPLLSRILSHPSLELRLLVTGTHLSAEHGHTIDEILADGFKPDECVEIPLAGDSDLNVARSMSLALARVADALSGLEPDVLVLLGDRYETLAAAAAASILRIPIAHIHGGETTEGAYDEAFRHSISKMSHLHFVAAPVYRDRVIQLGEDPERVFDVGSLGVENVLSLARLTRSETEERLGLKLLEKSLVVTFHPVTLEPNESLKQLDELLQALDALEDTSLIFTAPNADNEGRRLAAALETFCARHPHARLYESLGQTLYFSCVAHSDGVVGNSSSGISEAPALGTGTVNVGDRQKGRLRVPSIIDCAPRKSPILAALERLYAPEFRALVQSTSDSFRHENVSATIAERLAAANLRDILKKRFFDIPVPSEY